MVGHLCPLACGRHCTPCWRMVPAMCAMLRSIVSMSTSRAGVSSALTGIPTSVVSMCRPHIIRIRTAAMIARWQGGRVTGWGEDDRVMSHGGNRAVVVQGFRELRVWQSGMELVVGVYELA